MKRVMFGMVALFAVGCAGSQPRVVYRTVDAPSHVPVAASAPGPVAAPAVSVQPVAHPASPVAQSAPAPAPAAAPAPEPALAEGNACAHIMKHVAEAGQLAHTRSGGESEPLTREASIGYFRDLGKLDEDHPNLHHALKLRVASVSTHAGRFATLIQDGNATLDEAEAYGARVVQAIDALEEYCTPLVVDGEKS